MNRIDVNSLFCTVVLESLMELGVDAAFLGYGGRAQRFIQMAIEKEGLDTYWHNDERSGTFGALGYAKASGKPALVSVTSGSAIANALPALAEAHSSNIPIVIVSCDRQIASVTGNAPQTMDHLSVTKACTNAQIELPDPSNDTAIIELIRQQIGELKPILQSGQLAGPVHINMPLYGEYSSFEVPKNLDYSKEAHQKPKFYIHKTAPSKGSDQAEGVLSELSLKPGLKGLVIAGAKPSIDKELLLPFLDDLKMPVLADAASDLRRPAHANVICHGNALAIFAQMKNLRPDFIIRTGGSPTGNNLQKFLRNLSCPVLRIEKQVVENDYLDNSFHQITDPSDRDMQMIASALGPGNSEWYEQWKTKSDEMQDKLRNAINALPFGESKAASMICESNHFSLLYSGNSLPIRHINHFGTTKQWEQKILCNKGINGIDGNLSSFIGALLAHKKPGALLIGDLTMAHDITGLDLCKNVTVPAKIFLINNNGGAIFDFLETAGLPADATPFHFSNQIDFKHIARGFNVQYRLCTLESELKDVLKPDAWKEPGVEIVEIKVSDHGAREELKLIFKKMLMAN